MARRRGRPTPEVGLAARMADLVASDVRDATPEELAGHRPTGQEVFDAKTREEQNEMLGEEKASLVRAGIVSLADLVDFSSLETAADFITEKPLKDLPKVTPSSET